MGGISLSAYRACLGSSLCLLSSLLASLQQVTHRFPHLPPRSRRPSMECLARMPLQSQFILGTTL